MYDLNYTFLTELEVDTRQSYDDLSDDLLLVEKDFEESQIADMKSIISSWQNYFWQSDNSNKQLLDITFTDLFIYHQDSSHDYSGNALNGLEIMTFGELESFFSGLDTRHAWAGGKTFKELSESLTGAITALQEHYITKNYIYPKGAVLVTNENPADHSGFGSWSEKKNCYFSEIFSKSNYNVSAGYDPGSGGINSIGLTPTANSVPKHSHKLSYIPESGNGDGSAEGVAGTTPLKYMNERSGLKREEIAPSNDIVPRYRFSGTCSDRNKNRPATVVMKDASSAIPGEGGDKEATASFKVSNAKKDPADSKIKVAPKTYPLSASIWERS